MSDPHTKHRQAARSWNTDLVIVAAAVVCALITWAFATQVGGVDLQVLTGGERRTVDAVAVILIAALGGLAGMLTLRVLERFTPKALPIWLAIAVVVALLSMLGPLAATSPAAAGTLVALHGVVAAVVIVGAVRSRRLASR